MPAYAAMPEKPGKRPVVIVVPEIFGMHRYQQDICRRLAKLGYFAVTLDPYFRKGDLAKMTDIKQVLPIANALEDKTTLADLDALVAWIEKQPNANAKKIGITGMCRGGRTVFRMLQGRCEAAADDVAQHVEDHDIRVFKQVMLLEQLHRLSNDISAAARACGRPARFDAHHAIIALKHIILGAQFLAVELHALKHVDHCRREALCQRKRRVVLGVATDLQDALAEMRERRRQIG